MREPSPTTQSIRLRDGRGLAFAEFGDGAGFPVLAFHGGGLSRLAHFGDEAPSRAGVRLVLPDRPGFGRSDDAPGRTLLDWADDVAELADQLDLDAFAVFGVSAGGPPALACAYALPGRVAAAGVVSGTGPSYDYPELERALGEGRRALVELARRDPEAAEAAIREECERDVEVLAGDPAALLEAWPPGTPESDRLVLSRPEIRARFAAAFRESAARGAEPGVRETLLHYALPWGFRLEEIRVPVHVWHGALDAFVPVAAARLVAARIPGATLTVYPEEGHAVDYVHVDEILATLVRSARR